MIRLCGFLAMVLLGCGIATAQLPPVLRDGLNVAHWFRYPARAGAADLCCDLSPATLRQLRADGVRFLRLPVQPAVLRQPGALPALQAAVRRVLAAGLAVVVVPTPLRWNAGDAARDRARLVAFWRRVAPALAGFGSSRVFPEVMNEPVLTDPAAWPAMQLGVLAVIRRSLPDSTVIVTGADWGGIDGLLKLPPIADRRVIYSFHFYEPAVLTALAAFDPGLERGVLAQLPFPVRSVAACDAIGGDGRTAAVVRYYCAGRWDAAALAQRVGAVGAWAARHHANVLVGEFGAVAALNARARQRWLTAARGAFTANGFGWALWAYDDPMGLNVSPMAHGVARLDPGVMRALGWR
ncbi:glycoside hydrolase family 5 protein [Acidiphilium sp. PA]|uniref:glycoside hydrolase family 5 protein n=1 Tax=Acidiphilium sp. PA TaxID=2871705 RepID=UPI002242D49C|nr:cellulase family glycosylhydrolase [Acidiphilium sp. PA]MCW8308177.1 glycoside hydrolase family 5 protein [Acidiphilium sp. PA]